MLPIDERQVRQTAVFCHLAAYAGFIIPLGSLGGPLLVWLVKRADDPFIDANGREAVNFQLSLLLYLGALVVAGFATVLAMMGGAMDGDALVERLLSSPLIFAGFGLVGFALMAISFLGLICPIIAAFKADTGEMYRYPLSLRLVR